MRATLLGTGAPPPNPLRRGPATLLSLGDKLMDYLRWDIEVRREHMRERRPPTVRVTEIEEGRVLERAAASLSPATRGRARTSSPGAAASTA